MCAKLLLLLLLGIFLAGFSKEEAAKEDAGIPKLMI